MTVDGNATIRQNTNDPKEWQLLQEDGVTPIDITGFTDVEMIFVNQATDVIAFTFKVSDIPQKLSVVNATLGTLKLSPIITPTIDFSVAETYKIFFRVLSGANSASSIPEKKEYVFTVRKDFT